VRNGLVILFFICAMVAVFIGGYRSADRNPPPIVNNVTVVVNPDGVMTSRVAHAGKPVPLKPRIAPGLDVIERGDITTAQHEPARVEVTNEATRVAHPVAKMKREVEAAAMPTAAPGLLQISYPKPMFVGTPVPIALPNLEPPHAKQPWQISVPAGSMNLARGKLVTSSDPSPLLGELRLITDGDKSAEEGSYVELAGGKQWVQIDLGRAAEIYAILCWHYHLQARAYKAVVVLISDDPDFTRNVTPVFNNDIDNVCGFGAGADFTYVDDYLGKLFDAKGAKGRYVRLYSAGNTSNGMNHYIEIEVYGR
jgi:hypothetical protein